MFARAALTGLLMPPSETRCFTAEETARTAFRYADAMMAARGGAGRRMSHAQTLVYIAGPFSGKDRNEVHANIHRAELLGLKVAELGAYPIIPHANTSLPAFEAVQPYTFWIEATGELLERCDAVLFTDDWERSSGARGENKLAINAGLPRFFHLADLAEWLRKK